MMKAQLDIEIVIQNTTHHFIHKTQRQERSMKIKVINKNTTKRGFSKKHNQVVVVVLLVKTNIWMIVIH
jgi:hypothetical protein